jgi:Kef-type K+ transport system membrane component KefB
LKREDYKKYLFPLIVFFVITVVGERITLAQTLPTYTAGVMTKSYDEKRAKALENLMRSSENMLRKGLASSFGSKP